MNPICVKCGKEYICKKNGVSIHFVAIGKYKQADLFQCSTCGHKLVKGFGLGYDSQPHGPVVAELKE